MCVSQLKHKNTLKSCQHHKTKTRCYQSNTEETEHLDTRAGAVETGCIRTRRCDSMSSLRAWNREPQNREPPCHNHSEAKVPRCPPDTSQTATQRPRASVDQQQRQGYFKWLREVLPVLPVLSSSQPMSRYTVIPAGRGRHF